METVADADCVVAPSQLVLAVVPGGPIGGILNAIAAKKEQQNVSFEVSLDPCMVNVSCCAAAPKLIAVEDLATGTRQLM